MHIIAGTTDWVPPLCRDQVMDKRKATLSLQKIVLRRKKMNILKLYVGAVVEITTPMNSGSAVMSARGGTMESV